MNLADMTDEDLDHHRRAVLTEQERRQRIAEAPERVADLAAAYAEDGGDPTILVDAINGQEQP